MLKTEGNKIKKFDYCGACTFYLGAIVVTLICQALAGVVSALLAKSFPDIATNGDFLTAFMIFIQAANALFILLFCKVNKYRFDCALACKAEKKVDYKDFIIPVVGAIVLLCAMYLPTLWYGYFTAYALHISPTAGNIDLSTPSSVVMIVIASVFMAPVFEETIYRGVLFNGLHKNGGAVKAVLLCALAFMLMHMSPIQVVFQFALGALSAVVMNKTRRLLPCVLLHATANAAALAIQFEPLVNVVGGVELWLVANPVAAAFITLGLLAAGGAALFALIRFGYGKDAEVVSSESDDDKLTPQAVALADARKKDGKMRYFIALGISGVLFIINLITMIAG
ncbi:MAG: CPBP family intramembrane metalloprotease [Clostridiales bacterium]|nr:CPBP family intramembrane metalloprotease [Clostridiales bacterium]